MQRLTTSSGLLPLPMTGGEFGDLRVVSDDAGGNTIGGFTPSGRDTTLQFEKREPYSGSGNSVEIGRGVRLEALAIVFRGERCSLKIGDNVKLSGRITISGDGSAFTVGAKTTVERFGVVCHEGRSIVIGPRCMISYSVEIRNTDSHSIFDAASGARINDAQDVRVGEHVWIGAHSLICKGVDIPSDVVVGQGSIVTKSIDQSNCIVAGNPARVVRTGIAWDHRLLASLNI